MNNQENNDTRQESQEISQEKINESGQQQQPAVDWQEQYMRLAADFQNYKRRIEKEKEQWVSMARVDVLGKMIAVVDDFDRALAQSPEGNALLVSSLEGFGIIRKSLGKLLESYGVVPMTEYGVFDPEKHEALAHVPSLNHEAGHIVDVVEQGYMVHNTVLRPARVTVAQEHAA
jgi:molecular chaperone GrpE